MNGPRRNEVARAFARAAGRYAQADFLHREVRARLLQRLEYVSLAPRTVLDLGAGPPEATADLARRFPDARVLAVDLVPGMLGAGPQPWTRIGADAARLPLAEASVDLVVAGMLLHWCEAAPAVLAEVRRVLRFPGLFMLSTLGPDTLREWRAAWSRADERTHTLDFADMHNLGDALLRAGFAEPVLDVERLTVTYPDLRRMAEDLRGVGAADLGGGRRRTLTGPGRWRRMTAAYDARRDAAGALPVTVELVYGQAWADETQQGAVAGEVVVPLERLRRR
jgi:malonyl-CoA O-methyltransferase